MTGGTYLETSEVSTRLPAKDLDRARRFYEEKLGLKPIEERPGGLLYCCGQTRFAVFESFGAASGSHTQMAWEVVDIEATVAALKARGVVFEDYDLSELTTVNGIAEIRGNYPSRGTGEKRCLVQRQRRQPAEHRSARAADRLIHSFFSQGKGLKVYVNPSFEPTPRSPMAPYLCCCRERIWRGGNSLTTQATDGSLTAF